jgi:patatin-like phospholipase/acyl hydrolase
MKNILSIDGGGIRIYFPLRLLMEIEKRLNIPIQELFEYYTGVSAGSILIGMLLIGENGQPKYSLNDICNFLEKESGRIFSKSWFNNLKTLGSIIGPSYESSSIEECFKELYGETKIKDLLKPACLISYDIKYNLPLYFTKDSFPNLELWKVVRSSTAAPTYFYPYTLNYEQNEYLCVDGGVITNSPSEICLLNALKMKKESYYTFSLGTGYCVQKQETSFLSTVSSGFLAKYLPSYGMWYWSKDILSTMFNATSSSQLMDLNFINSIVGNDKKHSFYRLNVKLNEDIKLDDIKSFGKMKKIMDEWILKNTEEIDYICGSLVKNYEFNKPQKWLYEDKKNPIKYSENVDCRTSEDVDCRTSEEDIFIEEIDDVMKKSSIRGMYTLSDFIE